MPGKKSIFLGRIFHYFFKLDFVGLLEDAGIATHVVGTVTHSTIEYQIKREIYTYV